MLIKSADHNVTLRQIRVSKWETTGCTKNVISSDMDTNVDDKISHF